MDSIIHGLLLYPSLFAGHHESRTLKENEKKKSGLDEKDVSDIYSQTCI